MLGILAGALEVQGIRAGAEKMLRILAWAFGSATNLEVLGIRRPLWGQPGVMRAFRNFLSRNYSGAPDHLKFWNLGGTST